MYVCLHIVSIKIHIWNKILLHLAHINSPTFPWGGILPYTAGKYGKRAPIMDLRPWPMQSVLLRSILELLLAIPCSVDFPRYKMLVRITFGLLDEVRFATFSFSWGSLLIPGVHGRSLCVSVHCRLVLYPFLYDGGSVLVPMAFLVGTRVDPHDPWWLVPGLPNFEIPHHVGRSLCFFFTGVQC